MKNYLIFPVILAILGIMTTTGATVYGQVGEGNGALDGNQGLGGPDNPQPDREGSHDTQTSPNGGQGPTVSDPTITGDPTVYDPGDTVRKNCFGKVVSHEAQEHKTEAGEEPLGFHARDPVPELPGNETPRQGIGNQDQGHPAAHGAFNSQFEEEDAENVAENC